MQEIRVNELAPQEREEMLRRASLVLDGFPRARLAWAYGTFITGRPFGDLDIAVQFYGRPAWHEPADVAQAIWEAVGRPAFDVDVVPLNDATPFFRRHIADHGRLLFERAPGEAVEFGGMAVSEVLDLLEWRQLSTRR